MKRAKRLPDIMPGAPGFPGRGARDAKPEVAKPNEVTKVDPECILLTSGTSEAYSHIFRLLCEAGDEILVPAPSYPLFEFLADLADIRLVPTIRCSTITGGKLIFSFLACGNFPAAFAGCARCASQ